MMVSKKQITNLYCNDPDNRECSDFVKGFLKDSTIGVILESGSETEASDWESGFKYKQDPITEIMRFQFDRQLHLMEHSNLNETSLVLEEIFESFGFDVPKENREQLTNSFKSWMTTCDINGTIVYDSSKIDGNGNVKWEELVDSTCDQIVFLIGKLMKLRVDPKLALLETAKEVNSRKGRIVNGKFIKFKKGEEKYEPTYTADYSKCKVNYNDQTRANKTT